MCLWFQLTIRGKQFLKYPCPTVYPNMMRIFWNSSTFYNIGKTINPLSISKTKKKNRSAVSCPQRTFHLPSIAFWLSTSNIPLIFENRGGKNLTLKDIDPRPLGGIFPRLRAGIFSRLPFAHNLFANFVILLISINFKKLNDRILRFSDFSRLGVSLSFFVDISKIFRFLILK